MSLWWLGAIGFRDFPIDRQRNNNGTGPVVTIGLMIGLVQSVPLAPTSHLGGICRQRHLLVGTDTVIAQPKCAAADRSDQ